MSGQNKKEFCFWSTAYFISYFYIHLRGSKFAVVAVHTTKWLIKYFSIKTTGRCAGSKIIKVISCANSDIYSGSLVPRHLKNQRLLQWVCVLGIFHFLCYVTILCGTSGWNLLEKYRLQAIKHIPNSHMHTLYYYWRSRWQCDQTSEGQPVMKH